MRTLEQEKIAVIGLGYVGLPVAISFGRKLPTIGFDIRQRRVDELKKGHDDTLEVTELTPDNYRSSAGFDLVIFDDTLPSEPPRTAALYLAPGDHPGAFPLADSSLRRRPGRSMKSRRCRSSSESAL